jgi:hypothetical protein
MVGNDPVNLVDLLGLKDCCGNPRRPGKEVTDDAGRKCCKDEIKTVEIRVRARTAYTDTGHAYIHTQNHDRGFYPGDSVWGGLEGCLPKPTTPNTIQRIAIPIERVLSQFKNSTME